MGKKILSAIPGILIMLAVAVLARGAGDFGFPQWAGLEHYFKSLPVLKNIFIDIFNFNYVLICIVIGILVRNTIGVPQWAVTGVGTSRLFIKVGVILLGSLYSIMDLANLGTKALMIILFFVFFTMFFTLYLGKKVDMDPASSSVLAAGTAVCGVSAIIATAPVVRGKTLDVVYSIATILSFGLIFLLIFPTIGNLVGLSPHQFGVWAGTGILNSGQVLAATLIFDPGTANEASVSLKTGEIYNIVRVVFLPFVVLALAIMNSRREETEHEINTGLWSRFPVFVIGFFIMVVLTSVGVFGETSPPSSRLLLIRDMYRWFFAIGLAGLGMQISISELSKAGGKPILVGGIAAVTKAVLALIVAMFFISETP